jgi:hypothetical protein
VGNGTPDGAHVVHHGANELLVQQHSVPDREFTSLVQDGTQQAHPFGISANLADMMRPGNSFI